MESFFFVFLFYVLTFILRNNLLIYFQTLFNKRWEKAIQVAQVRDRVHMRTTHFKYATFLESIGDVRNAIRHYELSGKKRERESES